eukprot:6669598-Pyramimonas_sp.AAC.1
MGWKYLSCTDVKFLHRASTRGAWDSTRKIGIIPGCGADRQTRREALYSSSSFVLGSEQNPRATIPGCKFEHEEAGRRGHRHACRHSGGL